MVTNSFATEAGLLSWRRRAGQGATGYFLSALLAALLLCGTGSVGALAAESPRGQEVGVSEHPGDKIPLELAFRDETGKSVRLGDLINGPTVIMPVYFGCTNVCTYLQARMAGALQKMERKPLTDYRVLSISFDETDGPELAVRSKRIYLTALGTGFPPDGWRFLTGDAATIHRLTDAIGYRFIRQGKDFLHPVVTVVVTGDGTITRYLYGVAVLPKDLTLAITEAKSGITGTSVRKLMEFCFSYDPAAKTYVFNLLRVSATVVILCAGSFLAFLLLTGKKRKEPSAEKQ